jgi:hypothetical protein
MRLLRSIVTNWARIPARRRLKHKLGVHMNTIKRDRNVSRVTQHLNSAIQQMIDIYDRARKEHWTHEQLIQHRSEWILGTSWYREFPLWAQRQCDGAWDVLNILWWRDLKWTHVYKGERHNAYSNDPIQNGSKFNRFFDDKLSDIDTDKSAHCYLDGGKYYPISEKLRDWDEENNIRSVIDD